MITIIIGTNRPQALSQRLAKYYQNLLTQQSVKSQIIDLEQLPPDFIASALYAKSGSEATTKRFQKIIDQSSKLVLIVPEYNGSFPGILKTFIDALRYPDTFLDKKIALVGLSSGGQGGVLALSHLSDIFNYLGANVLAQKVKLMHIEQHFDGQIMSNDFYQSLLNEQIQKFINF